MPCNNIKWDNKALFKNGTYVGQLNHAMIKRDGKAYTTINLMRLGIVRGEVTCRGLDNEALHNNQLDEDKGYCKLE